MSDKLPLVSSSFRVGPYWCDMTIDADGKVEAEWRPKLPDEPGAYLEDYRWGRDNLVREWAKLTGIPVAIVEVGAEKCRQATGTRASILRK